MRRVIAVLILLIPCSLRAASYPPQLRWHTLTTAHFYIHYHQGEEELARRAATFAEQAHEEVSPLIGWTPRDRTDIVLTDHVGLSNGSATPVPSNRIEIFVSAPGADPASPIAFYDDWLKIVITHEYTHILHLDQARGFPRVIRSIFGRDPGFGFPNVWSPLWMAEGIATVSESEYTDSGRLKGTFNDMILRTAAIEDRWASESQASGLGPYWPAGNTRYFYGSKFLSWLAATHGAAKLTQYFNDYSSNIIPFRVNASAEDVYGTSMKSLWNQWSAEQQTIYRSEYTALAAAGLTERKRLTRGGYETKSSVLSPDGTRIAYAYRGPYERATIRIRDVQSGRDIATQSTNFTSWLSWSADGRSIAYSDLEIGRFSLLSDLYVWDLDRGSRRITHGARLKDPAFAPDGKTLIAVENRVGRNRIVEVDVTSGLIRSLVTPDDDRQFGEPDVSHDGSRIAISEWRSGRIDIVLYDRSGRRLSNLTESLPIAISASPRFSADDREIWFSSDVTGIKNLFSVSTSGGNLRRLTNVYGGAFYPTSRDGRHFFYTDYSADGFDVATLDATRDYAIVPRAIPQSVIGSKPAPAPAPRAISDLRATDYSPWRSLRPRSWYPIIETVKVNDETKAVFGFTTYGADVLARHAYQATVTNRSYGLLYAYDRFYPTLTLLASRYDDNVVRFVTPTRNTQYTETTKRLLGQVFFPYARVQWQVVGSTGFIRDSIGGDIPSGISENDLQNVGIFRGTLQGFRLGLRFNNAHEYLFSISPERGMTASLQYENLNRSLGSDRNMQQIRGDVRSYITIPYAQSPLGRHVVALRAAGARNSGDFIFQRQLKVGGAGAGEELAALDLTELPVRGFDTSTLRAKSATVGSIEYRFPLYEVERGPATWPFFFNRLHGDVFVDGGRAAGTNLASAGAEIAADFIIGNFIPIRYRLGLAHRLTQPDKGGVHAYIGFGSSF